MNRSEQSRPTLVLIHAFPFDSRMWGPQRTGLGEKLDIHTPDLPGFGGSARLDGEEFSMELAARFVERELDARKIDRCVIGGLSMGGYVTFECWRLFPERIAGLILADTKATADTEEARKKRFDGAEKIGHGGYAEFVEDLLGKLLSEKRVRERPEIAEAVRDIALSVLPETAIAALLGMAGRSDSTSLLPSISVPTALIFGEHDAITTVDEGTMMERAIPDAKLTILPNAGHLANIENAAMFNEAVIELMTRVRDNVELRMQN
jgi:pimeloyl-ACP methyl ester carboxylesterase